MATARTLFRHKYTISALQRNAASQLWGQLLRRERTIPQPIMSTTEPIQNDMFKLLSQMDPGRPEKFEKELNSLIFENRHKQIKLESKSQPEGVLLEAANNCKIPLAIFPHGVSMTFADNNSICINNEQYAASQILNEQGLFAKPKLPSEDKSVSDMLIYAP